MVRPALYRDKYCCLDLTLTEARDLERTDVMRKESGRKERRGVKKGKKKRKIRELRVGVN